MPLRTPPLPGDQVGPYTLGETVGVGGMATVYRAESAQGTVAVKILHPGKASSDEAKRFKREFQALKKLRHPGVVRVFEAGEHGDYPWISMEYVEGTDLGTTVETWKKVPPRERWEKVLKIIRGLSEALAYVHGRGLIHRDIKPSNILLTKDGRPKLTDFGVVKAPGTFSTELTAAGRLVGTVAFMAPEQITGDPIDPRADLYSLGAVLYVMLTLRRPIQADSIAGYLARHLTENPKPPSEHEPDCPPKLERICLKLLRKDPAQRFNSARQLVEEVDSKEGTRRIHLMGRETQIEKLMMQVNGLADGKGGVVIVHGDRGMGKSAVIQDFVDRARIAHHRVASCSGGDGNPLGILLEQLPTIHPNEATFPHGDEARLGIEVQPLAPAVAGIASRMRDEPWTLVIDDLDRMKDLDIDALGQLVRAKVHREKLPLLLVGSTTDTQNQATELLGSLATGVEPISISLEALDRRQVIAMVRDSGVGSGSGAVIGRRLHEDVDGNPGKVREYVDAMSRVGWLQPAPDGTLELSKSVEEVRKSPLPVPDWVLTKEERQLSGLPKEARQVLDVLALLGMEAPVDLLVEVGGFEDADAADGIQGLVHKQIASSWVEGMEEVVGFKIPRYRELAYRLMDAERRTDLHRRAARALLRRTRRSVGPLTEIIASHLLRGGEVVAAYPMLLHAARWSLRNGEIDDANTLVKQAQEVRMKAERSLGPDERTRNRRIVFSVEGELHERRGDLAAALASWESSLASAKEENNKQAVARATAGLGLVRAARGEPDEALSSLETAIKRLPQGDPVWPQVAEALANVRLMKGQTDGAEKLWTDLSDVGKATGNFRVLTHARMGLGLAALTRGRVRERWDHLQAAHQSIADRDQPELRAEVQLQLAEVALTDGRLQLAVESAEDAEVTARDAGLINVAIRALGVEAAALTHMGNRGQALAMARDGIALARARGSGNTAKDLLAVLPVVRAMCALGREDEVAALVPAAPPAGGRGLEDPIGQLLGVRARLLAKRQPREALDFAMKAFDRPPAPLPPITARIRADAAIAMVRTHPQKALRASESVLQFLRGKVFRLLVLEARRAAVDAGGDERHTQALEGLVKQLEREVPRPPEFRVRWLGHP